MTYKQAAVSYIPVLIQITVLALSNIFLNSEEGAWVYSVMQISSSIKLANQTIIASDITE